MLCQLGGRDPPAAGPRKPYHHTQHTRHDPSSRLHSALTPDQHRHRHKKCRESSHHPPLSPTPRPPPQTTPRHTGPPGPQSRVRQDPLVHHGHSGAAGPSAAVPVERHRLAHRGGRGQGVIATADWRGWWCAGALFGRWRRAGCCCCRCGGKGQGRTAQRSAVGGCRAGWTHVSLPSQVLRQSSPAPVHPSSHRSRPPHHPPNTQPAANEPLPSASRQTPPTEARRRPCPSASTSSGGRRGAHPHEPTWAQRRYCGCSSRPSSPRLVSEEEEVTVGARRRAAANMLLVGVGVSLGLEVGLVRRQRVVG